MIEPHDRSVIVYSTGIVSCSVCAPADMPPAEVAAEVNMTQPTGISSDWKISEEATFASGDPHPSPCDKYPEQRTHRLLYC